MATKNGLVESLVMSETATVAAGAAASVAAGAAASVAAGAAGSVVAVVPELQAAKITERVPTAAIAANVRPRVMRLFIFFPSKGDGGGCDT